MAVAQEVALACCRRARAREEAGRVGWWKRVIMSRGLCFDLVSVC